MKLIVNYLFRLLVFYYVLCTSVYAQDLRFDSPESLGLSSERLGRIEKVMNDLIDKDAISGSVTLVARHDKVGYLKAFGTIGAETSEPMAIDQIFRIASMSKAITTVGAMMLYEEGYFMLDDPLSQYIQEFAEMKVMVLNETGNEEPYQLVDASSPITIRHLLTQTSGITYNFFGQPYISDLYKQNGISDGLIQTEGTIGEMVSRLAKLPLIHQPGERFSYGLNTDVLGYLIEVLSGKSLDQFLNERVFDPLDMVDTYFHLPETKVKRLAALNRKNDQGKLKEVNGKIMNGLENFSSDYNYNGSRSYFSGGGGLASTTSDYYKFLQMLLNKGQLNGERLLGKKTVELMTTDQSDIDYYWGKGKGFGFGFEVSHGTRHTGNPESKGTYGWSGYFSSFYWVDPDEKLIGIIMTQTSPYNPTIQRKFKDVVYQSIVE